MSIKSPIGSFCNATEWRLRDIWVVNTRIGRLSIWKGFRSDGASIPRCLWTLVGPRFAPDTFPAALAHDALYIAHLCKRVEADAVFLDLLEECGCSWLKRRAYWAAVRVAGWIPRGKYSARAIYQAKRLVNVYRGGNG